MSGLLSLNISFFLCPDVPLQDHMHAEGNSHTEFARAKLVHFETMLRKRKVLSMILKQSYKRGYHLWAAIVLISIIPNFLLLFLNGSIIKVICSNSARLHNVNGTLISKDPKATKILFCIVGVSFVCHTPRIIYKCFYYLDLERRSYKLGFLILFYFKFELPQHISGSFG